jgi:glycosyltransferase involved in cell wall biosynthesis
MSQPKVEIRPKELTEGRVPVELSIIVPAKDEGEALFALYKKVRDELEPLNRSFELILINDGSTDNTQEIIEMLHGLDARVKGVELRRNFGQTAATGAGIDVAQGEIIITMDGDLQNDPADIGRLLGKIDEGYDIVSGWRKERKDKFVTRRVPSKVANWLISRLTGVHLHDYGCALKAYRREVLEDLRLYGDMHRFLPIYSSMGGAKIAEIAVNHYPRISGRSKYGLDRVFKVILDLLTIQFFLRFLTKPMRIFGSFGVLFFGAGSVLALYLTYLKVLFGESIGDRPLLLLSVLLLLVGIQLIGLGILGELISRVYFESQGKRPYSVRKILK